MPTYYTPPPSPNPSPFPSRSNSFSSSRSTNSSSRSRATTNPSTTATTGSSQTRSSSGSGSGSKLASSSSSSIDDDTKKKIPYVFLGSIAAASLLAHKCWPKGFPHGDKEDWELSESALRARQRKLAEKAGGRGGNGSGNAERRRGGEGKDERGRRERRERRGSHGGGSVDYGDRGRSESWGGGGRYRDGRRGDSAGHYSGEADEEYGYGYGYGYGFSDGSYRDSGRGWERERGRERDRERRTSVSSSRGRSRSRDRDDWRIASRERSELLSATTDPYYPPAPKRYLRDQGASAAGSTSMTSNGTRYFLERSSSIGRLGGSSSSRRRNHEDEYPGEVVYVYQEPPRRSRRVSFDAGVGGRHEGNYEWYYR